MTGLIRACLLAPAVVLTLWTMFSFFLLLEPTL
jgi:hypothetical protein